MKNRINKKVVTAAILSVLIMVMLCASAFAASYSKVYGRTKDKVRVRASASTSATVIDNIVKDACVYISTSSVSGSSTFVKVSYRNSDGNVDTGWICQHDGRESLVTILSDAQAQNWYGVKSGNLPSKKVGTWTASQRAAAAKEASVSSSSSSSSYSTEYVREIQIMLKELGYYNGDITGSIGTKTKAAVEAFQRAYNLSVDGIPGSNTHARLKEASGKKGGSSSSSSGSGLSLNSSGSDVRNLQQDLATLGYYWAEITGNFGSKTEAAVKSFQRAYNLTADGVAGAKTLETIATALKNRGYSSSVNVPTGSSLSLNMKSSAVESMQQALADLGYYSAEITGNFGPKTKTAVEAFQRANGLTVDGVAGPKTLEAINSANKGYGSSSNSGEALKLESTGERVRALQQDLMALGYYTGDVTGHFGERTKTAVRKFQKAKGLTNDGVAGAATLDAIIAALGNSGSLASSGGSSSGSLRPGDNNDRVKDMQERLYKLGIYYGEFTGNYGNLTEKAVRKFQDKNNLDVDGIAGSDTLKLLYSQTGGSYTGTSGSSDVSNMYGTLNTDNVSLRESYSKSAKSVVELDSGKALRITKTVTVNGETWYYCTAEKGNYTYKGYVRSDYVTLGSYGDFVAGGGDDLALGGEVLGMIRVTGDKVSIRDDHHSDADRIAYAYKGDVYYYISTRSSGDGWFQLTNGGWISQKYATRLTEDEMDSYGGTTDGKTSYRKGDSGAMVQWIQEALDELGYYDGKITGNYGNNTHDAVQDFQRDHDLSGDGIAGAKTIAAIREALSGKVGSSGSTIISDNIVYNLDWFTYKNNGILSGFGIKQNAKVTLMDIQTRKTFDAKIQSTGNHIDAEPVDASATKVLASLYGKSSGSDLRGIYKRRPMVLTTQYGFSVLVSIYPEPHGEDTLPNNGYDGQFCLHMVNSKTHGTDRVDDDPNGHQEMLKKGAAYLTDPNGNFKTAVSTAYPATTASTTGTVSGGTSSSNKIPSAITSPVEMHPNTTVYVDKSWANYHLNPNCEKLNSADLAKKTTYGDMKANKDVKDKPVCTKCKPTYVYFGDTSTHNYHYSSSCPFMAEKAYEKIYQTTEEHLKLISSSRTHVCSRCDKTEGVKPGATTTVVAKDWHKDTVIYTYSGWTYYHLNDSCTRLAADRVAQSKSTKGQTTYSAVSSDKNKKLCPDCKYTAVYYGDESVYSYHYKSSCAYLQDQGYANIYMTTEDTAKAKGREHDCSICKK